MTDLVDKIANAVPTNWCDPLLTGDRSIFPKGERVAAWFEPMLLAIRERVRAEAAAGLEAQKIQQWYRDALDEIDELLAAAKKSESRIAQLTSALEAAREETKRLDFVLENSAWIRSKKADSGAMTYWLETQDENENYIRLSGQGFYYSPRAAIDAARKEVGP